MAVRPVAPEGPAGDSSQETTAPSLISDKIPSVIDVGAEEVSAPTETVVEPNLVQPPKKTEDTPTESKVVTQEPSDSDGTQEILDSYKEDRNVMNVLRNDPVASAWLNDHFAKKARGEGNLEPATGDANAEVDSSDSALTTKVDKLFSMVEKIALDQQKGNAVSALSEFAANNPIVRDPKVAAKMQEILRAPGIESLSLERTLTIALSELGLSAKSGGPAPLRASESAGASISESSDSEDKVQQLIDSQDSFEKGLDVALRETAKEQGFSI